MEMPPSGAVWRGRRAYARRFHSLLSILTEIYLCHTCFCHEILRMETPGQATAPDMAEEEEEGESDEEPDHSATIAGALEAMEQPVREAVASLLNDPARGLQLYGQDAAVMAGWEELQSALRTANDVHVSGERIQHVIGCVRLVFRLRVRDRRPTDACVASRRQDTVCCCV
jgi:hypothetical protein